MNIIPESNEYANNYDPNYHSSVEQNQLMQGENPNILNSHRQNYQSFQPSGLQYNFVNDDYPPIKQNDIQSFRENKTAVYPMEIFAHPEKKPRPDVGCDCNSADRMVNCRIIMLYISMIISFILAVMLLLHVSDSDDSKINSILSSFNTIAESLSSDPILDLVVASTCPNGYTKAILGKWPGTVAGCSCSSRLYSYTCGRKQNKCSRISVRDPFDLSSFNSTDENICIKRAKIDVDYIKTASCPVGFSNQCYQGFCFSGSECPISNVTLTTTPYSSEAYSYQGMYLNVYKKASVLPMAGINISYFGMPCFQQDTSAYFSKNYALLRANPVGCGVRDYDRNAYFLASSIETYVLANNNATKLRSNIYSLPKYKEIRDSIPLYLVGKTRIETKTSPKCLNIDTNILYGNFYTSENLNTLMRVAIILEGILFANGFIMSTVFMLVTLCKREASKTLKKYLMIILSTFLALGFLLWIVCAPIGASSVMQFKDLENYVKTISDCFISNQATQVMNSYNTIVIENSDTILGYLFTILGFRAFLLIGITIPHLYSECRKQNI